jgi:hypothetical protein
VNGNVVRNGRVDEGQRADGRRRGENPAVLGEHTVGL